MKFITTENFRALILIFSILMIGYGAWLIYVPAAFIVTGLIFTMLILVGHYRNG